jgi:hypothetical protein
MMLPTYIMMANANLDNLTIDFREARGNTLMEESTMTESLMIPRFGFLNDEKMSGLPLNRAVRRLFC